jgi:hypothetical protein
MADSHKVVSSSELWVDMAIAFFAVKQPCAIAHFTCAVFCFILGCFGEIATHQASAVAPVRRRLAIAWHKGQFRAGGVACPERRRKESK